MCLLVHCTVHCDFTATVNCRVFVVSEKRQIVFTRQNLICNTLIDLVPKETTSEFRLTLYPVIAQSKRWSQLIAERLLKPTFGLRSC